MNTSRARNNTGGGGVGVIGSTVHEREGTEEGGGGAS